MGQHRLQPPAMGAKHHHLNNAAHMRKLLIWSLGIVIPFLLLFCIFPSSTSLYKPSYNRIVVSQLQVPASRFQSGAPEPDDDDPATVKELRSNDDDHSSDDDDDDDDDSTSENVKKQSDAATVAENSVPSNADSLPKATKKQSKIKEPEASIIEVVDRPLPAASKAKKQNLETNSESLSADEGDHSSSKAKKQSNGDEKETQSDSYEKRKRSNGDNKSDALPTKAKKVQDGEGGDHDFSIRKAKKPSDAQEQIDDELNLSSKKAKQQTTRGDGDEPEINAFMIEEEQNGELKEENQNKKKTGDSETKKNVKKGKITEEMSEVELGEAFSISGKEEADQPNIAHIEIKKSTKKAKAMHDTYEDDEVVEESIARTKKADRNDEGPSTAEPSRKEKDEENLSTLGKESSLEEDPATSSKKKSSRKAMDTSYDKEAAGFTKMGKKGKSFAKLGKSSDGGKSSAEDNESDVLFLKDADNEVFLTEAKKKKRTQNGSDLEEMEDADFNNRSKYSPEEAFSSSKKSKLKQVNDDDFDDGEEDFSSSKKSKYNQVNNDFDDEEEAFFLSKQSKLKKGNNDFYDVEEDDRSTKPNQKREKDVEFIHSSTYDEKANILERDDYEASSTMENKKRKQSNASKKLHDAYLDGDIKQRLDEVEDFHVDHEAKFSRELDEENDEVEEASFFENRKSFNKKTKNAVIEREDTNMDQKHEEDSESFESSPYKLATRRNLPSSQKNESKDSFVDSTMMPKKKKQKNTVRKVDNEDLNYGAEDESFVDDPIIRKTLPLQRSSSSGDCNYYEGRWTMDANYPPYKESTCPWKSISDEQSCKTTRKTNAWRWKPNECSIKRFKASAYLKLMQGKSVAFVGDMMMKAQLKSLVCLLAEVETPILLYNDKINQSMSWHFSPSNMTLSLIWSPYLVQQTSEGHYSKLQLDKLDTKWAEMVPKLDVLVLGVGTQFAQPTLYKVKDDVVGCYSCQGLSTHIDITNLKEISLYSGFRATMRSSIMGIGALPGYNGIVMFLQPFGFQGNGSYYGVSLKMKNILEQELQKAHSRGSISNQSRMEVLHTYLNSGSNFDPIKGLYSPTCLIPSPLADMWNQVLQHNLIHIFTLESES